MTKYAICPELFEHCLVERKKFFDFLLIFLQTNDHKILLDSEMQILDRYKKSKDPNGLFGFWIEQIEFTGRGSYYPINMSTNFSSLSDQKAMIALTKEFSAERYLATIDRDDYAEHNVEIRNSRINLLSANEALEHINALPPRRFDIQELSRCLVKKAKKMLEKKFKKELEDIYNDDFSEFLRGQGFYVADQTRSGRSSGGINPGEIDIMIRDSESGAPEAIIESLKIDSCGPKNQVISKHLNKLLDDYDTSGLQRNFIIIFSFISNFQNGWKNYISYMKDLNNKPDFTTQHRIESYMDSSSDWSCPAEIRTGLAIHNRNGSHVEVMHIFMNMCSDSTN
ncbi:hypothetical protein F7R01_21320 [Pseudomonas argentinensis]|uniref:Uncharacterized protein n=1 Tax=Phytopseudomonas argentinensis TaxID=289370 RepID=A0A1I3PVC2_9GAMM|nr:hypothetical protein [Pseudomonas argentinensis]KAB0546461.1 hypothetical protein F7R01_21320 [Pseudomonas argentinensis]SFJ25409.1 hypothetical protein SAMN05216602_4473 [Pseudomonas argentinensis]